MVSAIYGDLSHSVGELPSGKAILAVETWQDRLGIAVSVVMGDFVGADKKSSLNLPARKDSLGRSLQLRDIVDKVEDGSTLTPAECLAALP